jgi:hypothetical protein
VFSEDLHRFAFGVDCVAENDWPTGGQIARQSVGHPKAVWDDGCRRPQCPAG